MNKNITTVNYYALRSTTASNKNRYLRRFYRFLYRRVIKRYCNSMEWRTILREHEANPVMVNPYPWPLCGHDFADWEEDDTTENYSLISDPSGMVAKYATSYCACMIYAYTHRWIQYDARKRDASNWVLVLGENGFNKIVKTPEYGGRYVGILKDENADYGHGLVVWFENRKNSLIQYSTYQDHTYRVSQDRAVRFVWIEICPPDSLA